MRKRTDEPQGVPMKPSKMWAVVKIKTGKIEMVRPSRKNAEWFARTGVERVVRVWVEEVKG